MTIAIPVNSGGTKIHRVTIFGQTKKDTKIIGGYTTQPGILPHMVRWKKNKDVEKWLQRFKAKKLCGV